MTQIENMSISTDKIDSKNKERKRVKWWHFLICFSVLSIVITLGVFIANPGILLNLFVTSFLKKDLVINGLNLTAEEIDKLRNNDQDVTDIVFSQINHQFQKQVQEEGTTIAIEEGDIQISAQYPDKEFSSSCDAKVSALHPKIEGSLLNSSNISTGLQSTNQGIHGMMEATLDTILNIDFDFRIEIGKKIFGKCRRLLRETLGINLTSTGKVLLVVRITGTNVRIVAEKEKLLIKFDIDIELNGKPYDWNIDNVDVSKCDIGGKVKLGSYCNFAKTLIKEGAQKYLDKWTAFKAPRLLKKLEDKLQRKIGEEVSFPIIEI